MTEPERTAAFFDQSGQLVDVQYNAESIQVVNHLPEGANGKRCPVCAASPMRRTQVVWEENTRRHGTGTMILANIAQRVAPPRRPLPPVKGLPPNSSRLFERGLRVGLALVVYGIAGWIAANILAGNTPGQEPDMTVLYGFVASWVGALALAVLYLRGRYAKHKRAKDFIEVTFAEQTGHYQARLAADRTLFQQWKRSWFCTSCSAIVAEELAAARR